MRIASLLSLAGAVAVVALPAAAADAAEPIVAPAGAPPAGAVVLGPAPDRARLDLRVVLRPRDLAAANELAIAISTPGSPHYGDFLAPGEYERRFAPTPATIAALADTLRAEGLDVEPPAPGATSITARGTVAAAEAAFDTQIDRVRLDDGATALLNTEDATLPRATADDVLHVAGLDTLPARESHRHRRPPRATPPAPRTAPARATPRAAGQVPCQDAVDAAAVGQFNQAWLPAQLRAAYGFDAIPGRGAGMTIGLYEQDGFNPAGVQVFADCFGLSSTVETVNVSGGVPIGTNGTEAILDVEVARSLAPEADIIVYQAPNTWTAGLDLYERMIDDDRADIISTSWGMCEPQLNSPGIPTASLAESVYLLQMVLNGQTFLASAGDDGSSDCTSDGVTDGQLAVDDPGTQPLALSVGGTTLVSTAPRVETTWNQTYPGNPSWAGAGGGGISEVFPMPQWQQPFTTAQSSGAPCLQAGNGMLCRQVPDVSAHSQGDYGYITYDTGTGWAANGGTSASTPLWAALLASIASSPACGGERFGLIAPALYGLAGTPGVFNDVTVGTNTLNTLQPGFYPALAGYDMASGLGTPIGGGLLAGLCPTTPAAASAGGGGSAETAPAPTAASTPSDPTPVAPVTAPVPRPAPPAADPARAAVADRPLRLDADGDVPVRVACPAGGARCRVSVTLTAPGVRAPTRTRSVASGASADVAVRLPRGDRMRLRRGDDRSVRVRLRVTTTTATGGTVTQTLVRRLWL